MSGSRISAEELDKILTQVEDKERRDPKRRWINRMMRSAKQYHKMCPYYDKRTGKCFLKLGEKCERDGRFDGCPVFIEWLSSKYDELKSKGRQLPMDFLDLTLAV
ncbi:MAG: hypothetical protein DSY37_02720 [Hyperthermus sp.]|nr:MAG: hypothetical protein DSY37_02720 [Hyperthermus sp.]